MTLDLISLFFQKKIWKRRFDPKHHHASFNLTIHPWFLNMQHSFPTPLLLNFSLTKEHILQTFNANYKGIDQTISKVEIIKDVSWESSI
jgi:hypothetical protein